MRFSLKNIDGSARRGELTTAHGTIQTPAFMPVGTQATVKALKSEAIKKSGAEIILGNTYHLMLRPGAELIAKMGGLHKFMNWDRPILTDSGGFQVMSLSAIRKISDQGVEFSSHIDGSKHLLTPAKAIEIQHQLGSDITMIFDECVQFPATYEQAQSAMKRSLTWAQESKNAFVKRDGYATDLFQNHLLATIGGRIGAQNRNVLDIREDSSTEPTVQSWLKGGFKRGLIFGIVQGGIYKDLRLESASELIKIGFDGYAIGGLAVGEGQEIMFEVLDYLPNELPHNKPRYLMGVGKPSDIVGAVARGIDMFDCVIPTRSGRNGQAFVREGTINIRNAKYRNDEKPLDEKCSCYACQNHSRAYLHHLTKAGEILSAMLLSEHNIFYYQDLMKEIRSSIEEQSFHEFAKNFQFNSQSECQS